MRQTPLLKSVLSILAESHQPISVPSLQQKLAAQKITPNKTTLYRMLEKLTEEGVVERLLLDPKVAYYELKTHHHHHFRCDNCDEIRCLSDPELETQIHALEDKLKSSGLKIKDHHFSFSGSCDDCT